MIAWPSQRTVKHPSAFCKRGSVNVRFAPKATEVLRCRELTRCANNGHNAYQTLPPLEPLGASLTLRIGKIAIERKADILHQGVDAKMIALGRLAALSHMVEGPVKLRQVFDFNH